MLPRSLRIKKTEFAEIFKNGRSFRSPRLSARVSRVAPNEPSRFTVVVSSKTAKLAVQRNLIKRRIRYIISKRLAEIVPGRMVVINVHKDLSPVPFPELEQEVTKLLMEAGLAKK